MCQKCSIDDGFQGSEFRQMLPPDSQGHMRAGVDVGGFLWRPQRDGVASRH